MDPVWSTAEEMLLSTSIVQPADLTPGGTEKPKVKTLWSTGF
jgi:hypothetical protein